MWSNLESDNSLIDLANQSVDLGGVQLRLGLRYQAPLQSNKLLPALRDIGEYCQKLEMFLKIDTPDKRYTGKVMPAQGNLRADQYICIEVEGLKLKAQKHMIKLEQIVAFKMYKVKEGNICLEV